MTSKIIPMRLCLFRTAVAAFDDTICAVNNMNFHNQSINRGEEKVNPKFKKKSPPPAPPPKK